MFTEKKVGIGDFLYKFIMSSLIFFLLIGGGFFGAAVLEVLDRDPEKIAGIVPASIPVGVILLLLFILAVGVFISIADILISKFLVFRKELRVVGEEAVIKECLERKTRYNSVFLEWFSSFLKRNSPLSLGEFMDALWRILSLYYRGEKADSAIQETRPTWDELQELALSLLNPNAEGYEEIEWGVKIWIRNKKREEIQIT
jgi:hypothetical protein